MAETTDRDEGYWIVVGSDNKIYSSLDSGDPGEILSNDWPVYDGREVVANISLDDQGRVQLDGPDMDEPLILSFTGWLDLASKLNRALGRAHLMAVKGVQVPGASLRGDRNGGPRIDTVPSN